jgi:hypothetical protein
VTRSAAPCFGPASSRRHCRGNPTLRSLLPALVVTLLIGLSPVAWASTSTEASHAWPASPNQHDSGPKQTPPEKPGQPRPGKPDHSHHGKPDHSHHGRPEHSAPVTAGKRSTPTTTGTKTRTVPRATTAGAIRGQQTARGPAPALLVQQLSIKTGSTAVPPAPVAGPTPTPTHPRPTASATDRILAGIGDSVIIRGSDNLLGVDGVVLAVALAMVGVAAFLARGRGAPNLLDRTKAKQWGDEPGPKV